MPPTNSSDRTESSRPDIILLIHGTGAGAEQNEGEAWWQRESKFWHFLQGRLQGAATIQPADRVFHWSGSNSERERRTAADKLAAWLCEFEKNRQPYHLVGHSHGGSVIWRALNEAAAKGCPLSQLRSCTTVGTPFFIFSPKPLTSWTAFPIFTSLLLVAGSVYSAFVYFGHARDLIWERDWATLAALPLLWFASALMLAWWVGPVVTWFLARRDVLRDRELEKQTAQLCRERLMPISAALDEAINGLTTTLGFEGDLVPRNATRFRWFRAIYNNIVARSADEFVWERGSSTLQGNDFGGFTLVNVLRTPVNDVVMGRLPADVEDRMVLEANKNAAGTIAGIRDALGLAAVSGWHMPKLAAGFRSYVNWGELIHTSYFSVPEVTELILKNIERHLLGPCKGDAKEAGLRAFRDPAPQVSVPGSLDVSNCDETRTVELTSPMEPPKRSSVNSYAERAVLNRLIATAGVLLNVVLGVATWALFNTGAKTHTEDYLLQKLLRTAPIPVAAQSSPADLGKWISALLARHQVHNVVVTVQAVGNSGNVCKLLVANQVYTEGVGWESPLLNGLVDTGVWTLARDAIDTCSDSVTNKPDRDSQIDTELTLAETLLQHHHESEAKPLLVHTSAKINAVNSASIRAIYYAHLSGLLRRAGLSEEAQASVSKSVKAISDNTNFDRGIDPHNRASAVALLVEAGAYDEAARLLPALLSELQGTNDGFSDPRDRLAAAFARAGRLSDLQQTIERIPSKDRWGLPYLIPPTDMKVAAVIKTACPTPACKGSVDVRTATALVRSGKKDQVPAVLTEIDITEAPVPDLLSLAGEYIKTGELNKGVNTARTAVGSLKQGSAVDEQLVTAISDLAVLLRNNGYAKEAGEFVSSITSLATEYSFSRASSDQWFDGPTLVAAAKASDQFSAKEASEVEWRKAIEYARLYETRGIMGTSGSDQLVKALVDAKRFDEALEVTYFINGGNIEQKVTSLAAVAEGLFRNSDVRRSYSVLQEAMDTASTVSDSKSQSRAVGTIAEAAAICHRYHLASIYVDRTSLEDRIGAYTRLLNVL